MYCCIICELVYNTYVSTFSLIFENGYVFISSLNAFLVCTSSKTVIFHKERKVIVLIKATTLELSAIIVFHDYGNIGQLSFVDANGEKKSVDFLSGGTRDMAYIAIRAALIDMLYTEKPPVIFDESFAHQDNVRAKAMMRMIKQLSKEGCQSFIFTCRGRESVLAGDIIKGAGIYKLSVIEEERV